MSVSVKLILTLVIGYLLGSISTGVIVSRVFGHKDIRSEGSGNSGKDNNSGGSFICGGDKRQGGRELEQCIAADEEKFCAPFGKRRGLQVVIRSIDGTGKRQSPKAELIAGCAEDKVKRRPTETAAERF